MTLEELEQIEEACAMFNVLMSRLITEYTSMLITKETITKIDANMKQFINICFVNPDINRKHTIEIIPFEEDGYVEFNVVIDGLYFTPENEYDNLGNVIKVALVRIYTGQWPVLV